MTTASMSRRFRPMRRTYRRRILALGGQQQPRSIVTSRAQRSFASCGSIRPASASNSLPCRSGAMRRACAGAGRRFRPHCSGHFHGEGGFPGSWLARDNVHFPAGEPVSSAGSRWPDGTIATKGNVIIWSGEDDPADTLVPRLEASGADLYRIFFPGEMACGNERRDFDPAKDVTALQAAIEAAGARALSSLTPCVRYGCGLSQKFRDAARLAAAC
jgi:hypothetical protein